MKKNSQYDIVINERFKTQRDAALAFQMLETGRIIAFSPDGGVCFYSITDGAQVFWKRVAWLNL